MPVLFDLLPGLTWPGSGEGGRQVCKGHKDAGSLLEASESETERRDSQLQKNISRVYCTEVRVALTCLLQLYAG